nr:MAG TPA: zinc-finger double domain protein [Caudoviricetes sp.]
MKRRRCKQCGKLFMPVGSIAWVNNKAREAGMTYGEYVGRSGI